MERRKFIKSSCNLCLLTATGFLLADLTACSPAYQVIRTEVIGDAVQVPLNAFAQSSFQFIRPKGWNYDIAVQKKETGFEAILMQCTHQNNQLIPTAKGFVCNLHGSNFSRDGQVTKGPAEIPLKKFTTTINQEILTIHLIA